jgi:ribosomal protein S18 acetylase RimI-like enzyme
MPAEIRRALPSDAELVRTMVIELANHQNQGKYVTATIDDWQEFLDRHDVIVLIAEVDGSAAGYVSSLRRPYLWVGGDVLTLDDLYVREQFRNAGVGQSLMLELARYALPDRLTITWGLRLENEAGYRFYDRLGANLVTKTSASWSPSAYRKFLTD